MFYIVTMYSSILFISLTLSFISRFTLHFLSCLFYFVCPFSSTYSILFVLLLLCIIIIVVLNSHFDLLSFQHITCLLQIFNIPFFLLCYHSWISRILYSFQLFFLLVHYAICLSLSYSTFIYSCYHILPFSYNCFLCILTILPYPTLSLSFSLFLFVSLLTSLILYVIVLFHYTNLSFYCPPPFTYYV